MGGQKLIASRRRLFRGHDQVAFVLAVGIVRHNDDAALGDVAHDIVNSVELKCLLRLGDHRINTITSTDAVSNSYIDAYALNPSVPKQDGVVQL